MPAARRPLTPDERVRFEVERLLNARMVAPKSSPRPRAVPARAVPPPLGRPGVRLLSAPGPVYMVELEALARLAEREAAATAATAALPARIRQTSRSQSPIPIPIRYRPACADSSNGEFGRPRSTARRYPGTVSRIRRLQNWQSTG